MEQMNRAGFAGELCNWAEDHAEGQFQAGRAMRQALEEASCADDLEAADEELFEDDLLSLITHRPSRHLRHI